MSTMRVYISTILFIFDHLALADTHYAVIFIAYNTITKITIAFVVSIKINQYDRKRLDIGATANRFEWQKHSQFFEF